MSKKRWSTLPPLGDCERLVDHDPEAEGVLVEGSCRRHVMGGEADMVDRHGLGFGHPGGGDLDRLGLGIARRDQGHGLHGNARPILIADRSGHAREITGGIQHRDEGLLFGMGLVNRSGQQERGIAPESSKGVCRLPGG